MRKGASEAERREGREERVWREGEGGREGKEAITQAFGMSIGTFTCPATRHSLAPPKLAFPTSCNYI